MRRGTRMIATLWGRSPSGAVVPCGQLTSFRRPLATSADENIETLSLHSALLEVARAKGLDAASLTSWNRVGRLLLEPAGLTTVGDVLALPAQDVDEDLLTNDDAIAQRGKHLRELALPPGVLRALVHLRAGHYDDTLRGLAANLAKRRPASPFAAESELAAAPTTEETEETTKEQA